MSKKQNIITDLKNGLILNMMNNLPRYGTSMRSRISELIAEGHDISNRKIGSTQALEYFMLEHILQRTEIEDLTKMKFEKIHTIHGSESAWHLKDSLELKEILILLKNGYTAVPF